MLTHTHARAHTWGVHVTAAENQDASVESRRTGKGEMKKGGKGGVERELE